VVTGIKHTIASAIKCVGAVVAGGQQRRESSALSAITYADIARRLVGKKFTPLVPACHSPSSRCRSRSCRLDGASRRLLPHRRLDGAGTARSQIDFGRSRFGVSLCKGAGREGAGQGLAAAPRNPSFGPGGAGSCRSGRQSCSPVIADSAVLHGASLTVWAHSRQDVLGPAADSWRRWRGGILGPGPYRSREGQILRTWRG
jgi:hypothetical protein